jgi:Calcineurin-like phosphoesterase
MKSLLFFVAASLLLGLSSCSRYSRQDYTFVVCGDNRVAPEDTTNDPSTTNTYQLNRMFDEISKLNPQPKFLIFNGDLVLGYCDGDTVRLERELREWVKLYKASPLAKTNIKLVALPGNHETCEKIGSGKISMEVNERIFVRVMKDYIMNNNGPHASGFIPGTDSLMTDQSRLTYSFDFGGDHFVIFNSDAVARESRVPYHWLNKDLASAKKDGARHIFAFGHKPAFQSHSPSEPALEENASARDSLWACLEKYSSDAYFCSHFHVWDTLQPHKGKTWQIVVGNAGAPMVKEWLPYYYGFTIVKVSDKVDITSMGRDCDKDHSTAPTPDKLTMVRARFTID